MPHPQTTFPNQSQYVQIAYVLTLPAVMSYILGISLTTVLFPDPLEPTNATVCPGLTLKSNPCNTSTSGRDG